MVERQAARVGMNERVGGAGHVGAVGNLEATGQALHKAGFAAPEIAVKGDHKPRLRQAPDLGCNPAVSRRGFHKQVCPLFCEQKFW